MLTLKHTHFNTCQAMLIHDATINYACTLTVIIMVEMWITVFNPETKH